MHRGRTLAGLALGLAALFAGGCVETTGSGSLKPVTSPVITPLPTQVVTIKDFTFMPATITIRAGTQVSFAQAGAVTHTVTSGTVDLGAGPPAAPDPHPDRRFSSGPLGPGESFRVPFPRAGTYAYYCDVHPAAMRGVVIVN